jgi:uncharacterized protein YbjT (DUF2867 family)
MMRIAVVGATGRIGRLTVEDLARAGHQVSGISRSTGVDTRTGVGLDEALRDIEVVVDVTNTSAADEAEIVDFFSSATRNVLAAEQRAGVGHHVLLSIVGLEHGQHVPHYSGKRAQEALVVDGPTPWTIVRATQFHDFAAMVAGWTEQDGRATIAPLIVQPIDPADVAAVLAEVARGAPQHRRIDVAGPRAEDLVDMARRTYAVRGRPVDLVPTWRGVFGPDMAGEVLLPGPGARVAPTTFDDWLAAGAH